MPSLSWVLGAGCWVLGAGCWVLGVGSREADLGLGGVVGGLGTRSSPERRRGIGCGAM
ncbi:phosphotransferase [Glycomyces sp. NEAU-7082]|uniref:Phosphotransferase n=1 Tax=Glycomyces albidus TaxID=2656774 RepID=A0A6L5G5R9_9ACTN|nr:phosphotransferase [Glycomyces albidus]